MPQGRRRLDELRALDERERTVVEGLAAEANRRGRLVGTHELYPDVNVPASVGYTRQGVPLLPMSLLYERLVVYVPPTDQRSLQARWRLSYPDFLKLVEHGLVQPLVGHIGDYAAPHFRKLFEQDVPVPSVWTRGLTLLTELGLEDTLKPESYTFDFDLLASQPALVSKFRRHFPSHDSARLHSRIRAELLTNLADLALFGEMELIEDLQRAAPSLPPDDLARTVLLLSEVRTYPTLFGIGGTANYAARYIDELPNLGESLDWALHTPQARHVSTERYEGLLQGLGIDLGKLDVSDVVDFHGSGQAQILRSAVRTFEIEAHKIAVASDVVDLSPVLAEARALDRVFAQVSRDLVNPVLVRKHTKEVDVTSSLVQVGGLAVGGWVGAHFTGTPFGAIGGAGIFTLAVVEPMKKRLTDAIVRRRFRPGLANLWKISRRRR